MTLHTPVYHIKSDIPYEPLDTIENSTNAAVVSVLSGFVFAAARNALSKKPVGPWAVISQSGSLIASFGVGGTGYTFARDVSANLREKEDGLNDFYGGLFGGALMGALGRTVPRTVGVSLLTGVTVGIFSWAGNSLNGLGKDSAYHNIDKTKPYEEVAEKQGFWDMSYRRPLSRTTEELGKDSRVFRA